MKHFIDLSLLRHNRNFRLLYLGQCVSFFGTMITSVALPYQIYHQTHSTLMVGLLSLAQLLPLLITALLGGVLADRHHRRTLLLITEMVLALGCLSLAMNASLAEPSILHLFLVSPLMSAVTGLHRPALESIVQQVVDKKDYPSVGALSTLKYSVCAILGPAIGGILIDQTGLVVTYGIDFLSFAVSLLALWLMRQIPKPPRTEDLSTWHSLKNGFKYAFSRQELIGTYAVDFAAMIFGMPLALFPAIAHHYGGANTLGLLYSAPAVGALLISFFNGWKHFKRHGLAIAIVAALWGTSIIFFGLANDLWLALFFLVLAGGFDGISGIYRSIMWNETIPTHYRGRLAGIEMISYLSGPKLGDTEAGLVAAAFGITASVVSGGVLCVIAVGICCLSLPKFRKYVAS